MSRRRIVSVVAVALALLVGLTEPVVVVFCIVLVLNLVLGPRENVPFSTFPMFARPPDRAWTLRFEDPDGGLVPIGKLGINPVNAKKRFATELRSAAARGIVDIDARERHAAEVLALQIELSRPPSGPWAVSPISIMLIEFTFESGAVERVQRSLIETRPR